MILPMRSCLHRQPCPGGGNGGAARGRAGLGDRLTLDSSERANIFETDIFGKQGRRASFLKKFRPVSRGNVDCATCAACADGALFSVVTGCESRGRIDFWAVSLCPAHRLLCLARATPAPPRQNPPPVSIHRPGLAESVLRPGPLSILWEVARAASGSRKLPLREPSMSSPAPSCLVLSLVSRTRQALSHNTSGQGRQLTSRHST